MSPRPILKRSDTDPSTPTAQHRYPRSSLLHGSPPHAVHFPPSPTLTRTFTAYSATTYDRSPIVVTPNSCALPERGCPGRTYTLDDPAPEHVSPSNWRHGAHTGRHLHPRAVNSSYRDHVEDSDNEDDSATRTPTRTYPQLPPLIQDVSSSESDESDHALYPSSTSYHHPPQSNRIAAPSHPPIPYAPQMTYSNDSQQVYFTGSPNALSFLPHPPSPTDDQKARRRKQRDPSRSRRAADGSYKSLAVCKALSNCTLDEPEGGCLGGF